MLLLILGFARAAILCFGVTEDDKATECPNGEIFTDGKAAFTDAMNEILVKGANLVIGSENIMKVNKISVIGSAAVAVKAQTAGGEMNKLELVKIQLSFEEPTTAKKLLAGADFTIAELIMDADSTIAGTANKVNVKITNLVCEKKEQIKVDQLTPTSIVTYTAAAESIITYALADKKVTVDGIELADGSIQKITVNAKAGAKLTFPTPPPAVSSKSLKAEEKPKVQILVNSVAASQTIEFVTGYDVSNTAWKVDASVATTIKGLSLDDARLLVGTPSTLHFFSLEDNTRLKLAAFVDSYCIGEATAVATCADVTLKNTEFSLPFFQTDKLAVTLLAYGDAEIKMKLDDLKGTADVLIKSGAADKQAKVGVEITSADTFNTSRITFDSVELTIATKSGTTKSTVSFSSACFFNSTIKSDTETLTSAKTIKAAGDKLSIVTVKCDSLSADVKSLNQLLKNTLLPQQKSVVLIQQDIIGINVSADNSEMTVVVEKENVSIKSDLSNEELILKLSGGKKDSEKDRVPFEIQASALKESKTFNFALNMSKGFNLFPIFIGDWSQYTIEVRGEGDFVYDSVTQPGSKSPKIENKSSKPIIVDGKEISNNVAPAETTKSGLSGGAIAGIVIACVVVVAAVAVSVFFVLKKKTKVVN